MKKQENTSYKQMVKSTGIFGGSQFLVIVLGMVRTKVLAMLLGTSGVGLVGLFQSVIDFVRSLSGLGLGFSSVKDIAEANQSNDEVRMAQTIFVLRRWLWWTGLFGLLLMVAFSLPISLYLFGNTSHALSICLLSFCVLTGTISSGQVALLQGTRQILKMAKASVYGASGGLVVSILMYWVWGKEGIVPALIAVSTLGLFFSWWFTRGLLKGKATLTLQEVLHRGKGMVKLGLYSIVSGLVSALTLLLIKNFILQEEGISSVGLFQAVWSVSTMYFGAILSSMGADYFPKLCGLNHKPEELNRFCNEQTRFVMNVATPLMVALLLLASPVLQLLYSSKFVVAASLLRWQVLGMYLKVLVWPLGFVLLAKGKGLRFFTVELTWFVVYYLATRLFWPYLGLNAAGVGYVVAYLVYVPMVYQMVKPLCNFKFEPKNRILTLNFLFYVVAAFGISQYLTGWMMYLFGGLLLAFCLLFSGFEFHKMIPIATWLSALKSFLKRFLK